MTKGWLYDGRTAVRHEVEVAPSGSDIAVKIGELVHSIPAGELVHVQSRVSAEVYGRRDLPGWRLGIVTPLADLEGLLPAPVRYGRLVDRLGFAPAAVAFASISAALLWVGSQSPEWLAPLVPPQWEQSIGDSLVGDFGEEYCNGRGGQAALDKLTARLSTGAHALKVRVVDIGFVNAAALPGGNIVIFEELLAQSDSPDEVAGVLAHEIAHVEERHVTEAMIRAFGISLLVSAAGGNTGANVDAFLATRYSRDAEKEADRGAIEALRRANISPLPTANFFKRVGGPDADPGAIEQGLSYLATHPLPGDRQRTFRESAVQGREYQPALTREEWDALFDICKSPQASWSSR